MAADYLPGFSESHFGRSMFDPIPDAVDPHWHQHLVTQLPVVTPRWGYPHGHQMGGMQEFDLDMFHQEPNAYPHPHPRHSGGPSIGYPSSDMDTTGTPDTNGYGDMGDSFQSVQPPTTMHLPVPHRESGTYSPHSSHGGISPHAAPLPSPQMSEAGGRPSMPRSVTDPMADRKATSSNHAGAGLKQMRISDDDEDYIPSEDTKHTRGRKRQRIPHTAVERRYRENLNAHLDKLRQTVPSLAVRKGPDGKGMEGGQGVKPSKCEILNGAIEHIGALDKEIVNLKAENQALKARVEQMQNWYRTNSR